MTCDTSAWVASIPSCTMSVTGGEIARPISVGMNVAGNNTVAAGGTEVRLATSTNYTVNGSAGSFTGLPVVLTTGASNASVTAPNIPSTAGVFDYAVDGEAYFNLIHLGSNVGQRIVNCTDANITLHEKPIVKVLGGDVSTGGHFGTSNQLDACQGTPASVIAGLTPSGNVYTDAYELTPGSGWQGSSVQFALRALGQSSGYYSASQRTGSPLPPVGLTFGNATLGPTPTAADLGGFKGSADPRCINNYWLPADGASFTSASSLTLGSAAGTSGTSFIQRSPSSGPVSIADGSINGRQSVFVDGDVTISTDITTDSTTWASRDEIPVTYIIVRGNIYIPSTVSTIDAILIALPDPSSASNTGNIYTCSGTGQGRNSYAHAGYAACTNKLTINGAVVAKELHLGRVGGTAALSSPGELPSPTRATDPTSDQIAEVINYTPEIFLSTPAHGPHPASDTRSDSVIGLPPTL
ncbi:MAG: hypothetical protein AAF413_01910 [Patescibacteria group bacterium]